MAGCAALVKSVLASQAVYYFTPLSIPVGTFNYIYKIERAFLWSANDNTTSAKENTFFAWSMAWWAKTN
jgi:hypothetical protein